MNVGIRKIRKNELELLNDFLYEAIFIPKEAEKPGKEIIERPELQMYIKDFGTKFGDFCLVAEIDSSIVGAVWSRIIDDYGHIDDETPSLSISLFREYRRGGIGCMLMKEILDLLKMNGFKKASLSVQRANYASKMYKKIGFKVFSENDEAYSMFIDL